MTVRLLVGDCREIMAAMPENSADAIVTDPPYGIRFMGKAWDGADIDRVASAHRAAKQARGENRAKSDPDKVLRVTIGSAAAAAGEYDRSISGSRAFQAWCELWAREAYRVLKPGGHLLAFGGSRTYHRLACAIEDAGFEIRDQLQYLYGSGFPKSHNLKGDWQGFGTALKPAHEPIVLARKPLTGTVAANVERHGTGALNIAGTRIGLDGAERHTTAAKSGLGKNGIYGASTIDEVPTNDELPRYNLAGRWPANVLLDEDAAALLDAQSGASVSRIGKPRKSAQPGNGYGMTHTGTEYADSGGASRFFYCAKASRSERNAGLDGMPEKMLRWSAGDQNPGSFQSEGTNKHAANHHPTVKPIALMRWLVRLVTPPGGLVLDPFAGSGTTGIACVAEGFDFIGIEQDAEYLEIARRRIEWAQGSMFASVQTS